MKTKLITATLAFWVMLAAPAFAAQTVLYFNSQPGDYIGQGKEVILTTDEIDFFPSRSYDGRSVRFWMHNISRNSWPNYIWWNLTLSAPYGTELVEGTYNDATRYPFQDPGVPGLSFYGDGRGCNQLTGFFDVLEAVYDPDTGAIVSFAVDFVQNCEGWMPPLYGSIRYNSDVPLPVLIPPMITLVNALNDERCVEATAPDGATVSLTGSATTDVPVDYHWTTTSGEQGYGTDFSLPLGVDQTTTVTLTITDPASGDQASKSLDVCVSDTTPPLVTILSPLNGQTFVGENAELVVQVSDLVDKNITSYRKLVGETATIALDSAGTSSTMLFRKVDGDPVLIQITAEARDYSGNVGSNTVTVYQVHDLGN